MLKNNNISKNCFKNKYRHILVSKTKYLATKMAQKVKILVVNLRSVLWTHMVEGENLLLQVVL